MGNVKDLFEVCLGLHEEFDRVVWKRESFHNALHVRTNVRAALMLIDAAEKGVDPVGIVRGMEGLGSMGSTGTTGSMGGIDYERLRRCLRLAFGMHDLGNVLRVVSDESRVPTSQKLRGAGVSYEEESFQNGETEKTRSWILPHARSRILSELGVEFLPGYRAVGAEGRSLEVGRRLMDRFGVEEQDRELVEYLMGETSFVLDDREKTLALMMRVCDQLSNGCLIEESVAYGLMLEWADEDPDRIVVIDEQVNFTGWRIMELIPSQKDREKVLEIWGAGLPERLKGSPKEEMLAVEAVEWMEGWRGRWVAK